MKPIKQLFILTLFAILLVLTMFSPSWATTYYVDATNGNDSNIGTSEATPWKSIAKINASTFNPGDFILFKRAEIWREQLIVPSSGSKEDGQIVFGAYGIGNKPIISGTDLVAKWSATDTSSVWKAHWSTVSKIVIIDSLLGSQKNAFDALSSEGDWFINSDNATLYIYSVLDPNERSIEAGKRDYTFCDNGASKGYIKIENLEFQGSNSSSGGAVDCRGNGGPWIIRKCTIKNTASFGVMALNDNCIIDENNISYCAESGIYYHQAASGSTITNNTIAYNLKNAINIAGDNVTITHNTAHHNGWHALVLEGREEQGINSEHNIIRYNHFYTNGQAETIGDVTNRFEIYFLGADNNDISYNLIHDASTIGLGGAAIYLDWGATGNTFYNNTIYNITAIMYGFGIGFENWDNKTENNTIKNNIFSNCRIAVAFAPHDMNNIQGNVLDYNCYHIGSGNYIVQDWDGNRHSTLASWQAANGSPDYHSISGDPQFLDTINHDFNLRASSPCKDAGTDVLIFQDFKGIKIPQGGSIDIGAFEYMKIPVIRNFRIISSH